MLINGTVTLNKSQPVFVKLLLRCLSRFWRCVLGCCTRDCTDRSFKHREHGNGQYPSSLGHWINIGCLGFEMMWDITKNILSTEQLLRAVVITLLLYVSFIIFAVFLHQFLGISNTILRLWRDFQYLQGIGVVTMYLHLDYDYWILNWFKCLKYIPQTLKCT